MNGSRIMVKTSEYTPIVRTGGGYAVRLATFSVIMDEEAFTSAYEVVIDHEPTESEIATLENEAITKLRISKVSELTDRVNCAPVKEATWKNGEKFWWDSEQRASIRASIAARTDGEGVYLEIDGTIHPMSANEATGIINTLEVYASDCHRRYCEMVAEIAALETPQEMADYVFEFPEPVNFSSQS